jgi:hypothetical protein
VEAVATTVRAAEGSEAEAADLAASAEVAPVAVAQAAISEKIEELRAGNWRKRLKQQTKVAREL